MNFGVSAIDQVKTSELSDRITQLERIAHEINDAASRVCDVADRTFGAQPMCAGNGKEAIGSFSLFSRFDAALQAADRSLGELRENIARVEVI